MTTASPLEVEPEADDIPDKVEDSDTKRARMLRVSDALHQMNLGVCSLHIVNREEGDRFSPEFRRRLDATALMGGLLVDTLGEAVSEELTERAQR